MIITTIFFQSIVFSFSSFFFPPLALSSLFTSMPTLPISNPRYHRVCVLPHFTGRQTDRQTHTHTHRNDIHILVYLPFLFNTSWESVQTNCVALNHSFQGYKIISCFRHTFDLMWIFFILKKKRDDARLCFLMCKWPWTLTSPWASVSSL